MRAILGALAGPESEEEGGYAPVTKSAELRYTFGPMYAPNVIDAHKEYMEEEDIRKSLWEFSLNGDRTLRKQHGNQKVGDIVELVQWPFDAEVELSVPGEVRKVKKVTLPAGTAYAGVVWTPEGWEDVKKGRITGFSVGGRAVRMYGAAKDTELLKFS